MKTQITDADDGIRLDRWFKRHMPQLTHAYLEKALREKRITLAGRKAKSSDRIACGQELVIDEAVSKQVPSTRTPQVKTKRVVSPEDAKDMKRMVIYKDAHVLILNKPSGLAVQGGTGQDKNIDDMLDALQFDSEERPKLVHRLDKDTSGVLVLARSTKAAQLLTRAFSGKTVRKVYWALVMGIPEIRQGKIDAPLAKLAQGKDSRIEKVEADEEAGKRAVTYYRVVEHATGKISWLEMMPITGRTHQLRVHAALINTPIIGDGKYGGSGAFVQGLGISKKLHLHAQRIILPPLFGSKVIDITAPLPKHMQESWKLLEFSKSAGGKSIAEEEL